MPDDHECAATGGDEECACFDCADWIVRGRRFRRKGVVDLGGLGKVRF